jgi:hypothetical protein
MTTVKNILTILIGLTLVACNNSTKDNKNVSNSSDTIKTILADSLDFNYNEVASDKRETEIVIKNKSDYSVKFIRGLKNLGYEKFELKDSLLLINSKDTAYFPKTPKIGKRLVLTGRKGNLAIALTVKRINYTTVDYKIEMVESGKKSHNQSGQADIVSSFFFGSESDESEKTGNGYSVTEFTEYKEKNCYTFIRLGYEKETGPYLLGKLKKNCNGKIIDIDLENFTTLIEK